MSAYQCCLLSLLHVPLDTYSMLVFVPQVSDESRQRLEGDIKRLRLKLGIADGDADWDEESPEFQVIGSKPCTRALVIGAITWAVLSWRPVRCRLRLTVHPSCQYILGPSWCCVCADHAMWNSYQFRLRLNASGWLRCWLHRGELSSRCLSWPP